MLYVVIDELIPSSHKNEKISKYATFSVIIGFIIMMTLDVVLS